MSCEHDAVLRILYPSSDSPEWAFAYDAAWREAESRAKTLGFLYPLGTFHATCAAVDEGARFSVLGLGEEVHDTIFEVVRILRFDDYCFNAVL